LASWFSLPSPGSAKRFWGCPTTQPCSASTVAECHGNSRMRVKGHLPVVELIQS